MPKQTVTIWSAAIDNDCGLYSGAHTSEADAWIEVVSSFAETDEERAMANEFIAAGNFGGLRDYVGSLIEKYNSIDSYTIEKQELIIDLPEQTDKGVSEDENVYGVTITADVTADIPGEAPRAFIEDLGICRETALALIFHVSNLKSGEKWELDVDGNLE
jgi:hypothetical protein